MNKISLKKIYKNNCKIKLVKGPFLPCIEKSLPCFLLDLGLRFRIHDQLTVSLFFTGASATLKSACTSPRCSIPLYSSSRVVELEGTSTTVGSISIVTVSDPSSGLTIAESPPWSDPSSTLAYTTG